MLHASPAVLLMVPLLIAASCRAADSSDPPADTRPAALTAAIIVTHHASSWVAEITLTNATDHPLSSGRYTGFTLTRTDTHPAQVVTATPPSMSPHFRVLFPAGESRKSSVVLWDKAAALPAGDYHVVVNFPPDVLPAPVEADFVVPAAASQP